MKKHLKVKKRLIKIIVLLLAAAVCMVGIRDLRLHLNYKDPNQSYFGEQYSEIFRITSISDMITADKLIKKIDSAFSFIGTEDKADEKFGILSRYSVKNELAEKLKEEHKIKFVAADFKDNAGYLWIEYSQNVYTSDNEDKSGSSDILVRVSLEKIDDEWIFTDCKEHP